ncbi:MAG: hypothetical protein OXC63_09265 [Aestuariivita sp.]|nr:hypothetical protein [Aestuariivita sp.]
MENSKEENSTSVPHFYCTTVQVAAGETDIKIGFIDARLKYGEDQSKITASIEPQCAIAFSYHTAKDLAFMLLDTIKKQEERHNSDFVTDFSKKFKIQYK